MNYQPADDRRAQARTRQGRFGRGGGAMRPLLALGLALALIGGAALGPTTTKAQSDGALPALGTAVPIVGVEGGTLAEVTVDGVADPFIDYDPFTTPQRAYHFILLTLTVENTSNRPFAFDPNTVAIQDSEGFLARPLFLTRPEAAVAELADFPSGDIAPGDALTGAIAYQTLNAVTLQSVVFTPTNDRLIVLADLGGGTGGTDADADDTDTAAPTEDEEADEDAAADAADATSGSPGDDDEDDTDTDTDTTAATDLDCDAAETWAVGTGDRLDTVSRLVTELETFDRETADPVRLAEISAEFADLAAEQENAETPPALQESSDLFVDAFETFSDLFDQVAEAAETGDLDAVADSLAQDVIDTNAIMAEAGELAQAELAACGLS